jgi:hypothetical protein
MEERINPKKAVTLLKSFGIETDEAGLAHMRNRRRGPAYIKIDGRVYYQESDLLAWARGVRHHTSDSLARTEAAASGANQAMNFTKTIELFGN